MNNEMKPEGDVEKEELNDFQKDTIELAKRCGLETENVNYLKLCDQIIQLTAAKLAKKRDLSEYEARDNLNIAVEFPDQIFMNAKLLLKSYLNEEEKEESK